MFQWIISCISSQNLGGFKVACAQWPLQTKRSLSKTIAYVLKIIVSSLYCLIWMQESKAKHKYIFVPLARKKSLVETNVH
jgi:hypothetical protein